MMQMGCDGVFVGSVSGMGSGMGGESDSRQKERVVDKTGQGKNAAVLR